MRSGVKAEANLVKISAGADTETLGVKSEVKVLNLETYVKVNDQKYGVEVAE